MRALASALFLNLALAGVSIARAEGAPRALVVERAHSFGQVKQGEVVVHEFSVANEGSAPLLLDRVEFNLPGLTSRFRPGIEAGAVGTVRVEVNTIHLIGEHEIEAVLFTNDPAQPRIGLTMIVAVEPVIEIQPLPAAYFSIYADEEREQVLRVVNHEERPLEITRVEPEGEHFRAHLKEVRAGEIFELVVTVPAGTAPGRYEEAVLLHTNHPKFQKIPVGVNIFVKRDLYANPERVDFTGIDLSKLAANPQLIEHLYETIMLKKRVGEFEIESIETDVPFLTITRAPATGRSSGFQLDVAVTKEKLVPGLFYGSIRIATDDERFPVIEIPVDAEIR